MKVRNQHEPKKSQEQHHPKSMQACSKVSTFFFQISTKKTPVQQYGHEDNYDDTDYYDEFEPVVAEPKTKEYYNSKYKQAGKRRGK